jgi:hypothetical protein
MQLKCQFITFILLLKLKNCIFYINSLKVLCERSREVSKKDSIRHSANQELGIGYFKPISVPSSSFTATISKWRKKLAQSGFNDIEVHDKHFTGKVQPFFAYGGSATDIAMSFDSTTAEYYNLCRDFLHAFNFKMFKKQAPLMRYIWHMHSEGIPIRSMCKALAGLPVKYPHNKNIKKPHPSYKQSKGLAWMHKQVHKMMPHFNDWRSKQVYNSPDV